METAKERFLGAISRPDDRTYWPTQRSMKWIMVGFMISQLLGLPFLIAVYTYLFTNEPDLLRYLLGFPGIIMGAILSISLVGISKAVKTKKIVFITLFFIYDIIISIISLSNWAYVTYLFLSTFQSSNDRKFAIASATMGFSMLGLFCFWVVPVGLYFLVTTPWWQPWAKKEKWYNPDDDKAAHPDRG
jgi:hypothetical protein